MVPAGRLPPDARFPAGRTDLRTRYVSLASGLRVRVVEAGADASPPILFIPGWACGAYIFRETLAPVAGAGFRAIAVEIKGHGFSDKPRAPGEYTVESLRGHVIEIMDALGLSRAGIVGHSMGAAIGVHVAAFAPERICGVVLVSPVGFAGVPALWLFRALTPAAAIPLLRRVASRTVIRMMLRLVYGAGRRVTERDVEEFIAPAQFPDFTRALRHLLHTFGWSEPFPALRVPWMTIVGTRDILSDAGDVDRYRGSAAQAAAVIVPGAGHILFDEVPDVVNVSLIGFFRANR